MSRRHKRRSKLFDVHAARFVSEAAEFHDKLSGYLLAVRPQDDQYKSILAVSEDGGCGGLGGHASMGRYAALRGVLEFQQVEGGRGQ